MRQIILTSVLLGLPLAAAAQEEPQTTQTQYGQEQQTQDTRTQQQDAQSQQQAGMQASTGNAEAEVARAQFTSKVEDREPVDEVSDFEAQQEPLYFFTEVKNGAGQTITHRWTHDGEVMAEVPLEVGSDSWRTWSSKEFVPGWDGEWTVEVVDAQGNTLTEESITVETEQMQNVGYSPDEQGQQDQQPVEDQSGMESEQIDYEQQTQDTTQQQEDQSEMVDYEQQTEDMQTQDMQTQEDETNQIDYEPPTEETQSQEGTQSDDGSDQDSVGQDY